MNEILDRVWEERIVRLAVGIRLLDAVRGGRPVLDAAVALEDVPQPHRIPVGGRGPDPAAGLPVLEPRRTGRMALAHPTGRRSPLTVRVFDRNRRYVPRRLRLPFPSEAEVRVEEEASRVFPYPQVQPRGRAIALYPGAAYDASGATGVRCRVTAGDGRPLPWARLWATSPGGDRVEGVAHADDRGEFVLLLRSTNVLLAQPPAPERDVELHVALAPPFSESPGDAALDPLATLPVEDAPALGQPDDVTPGDRPPPSYTEAAATYTVTCRLGRVTTAEPFAIP